MAGIVAFKKSFDQIGSLTVVIKRAGWTWFHQFSCLIVVVGQKLCGFGPVKMPTWAQIQSQLRSPSNPVVFFDISIGNMVWFKELNCCTGIYEV